MAPSIEIKKLAVIGCGSMGGGMALHFAEAGLEVGLQDPSEETMDKLVEQAKKDDVGDKVKKHLDYKTLTENLGEPKVFVFSLPHGSTGDSVLEGLLPYLTKGDIIMDAGNEHWENTERRQGKCFTRGIRYVGVGVSGGYQAARKGPSMCPGGDDESLSMILPLLQKVAAKDRKGNSCVAPAGSGGAGHYIKMVHNGIEHGMMSAVAEAWQFMEVGLGIEQSRVADIFSSWNSKGELQNTFLVEIGADLLRQKDPKSSNDEYLLPRILDKVTQDLTGEEGTGIWSNEQAVSEHIPAPTLTTSHYLRIASAFRGVRERANKAMDGGWPQQKFEVKDENERAEIVEDLRKATYLACLVSFIQGVHLIQQADRTHHWNIDFNAILQIWGAGCIIQADYINDILTPIFARYQKDKSKSTDAELNLFFESSIAGDIKKTFPALKSIVLKATQADAVIPALGASLEYIKYQTGTSLPTSFYEAELDFFGSHMFDRKGEKGVGGPTTGKHHVEWRPTSQVPNSLKGL